MASMGARTRISVAMRIPELEEDFPNLATSPYDPKSPPDAKYNCIAFALGDTSHFWYDADVSGYYWPPGAASADTLAALRRNLTKCLIGGGFRISPCPVNSTVRRSGRQCRFCGGASLKHGREPFFPEVVQGSDLMEHREYRTFETRPWPSLEVSGGGLIGVVASRPGERSPFHSSNLPSVRCAEPGSPQLQMYAVRAGGFSLRSP